MIIAVVYWYQRLSIGRGCVVGSLPMEIYMRLCSSKTSTCKFLGKLELLKVIEVGLVGVQEVINDYRSCLLVPNALYWAWMCCRLTVDGVIHETLTIKDIDLQILRETRVVEGHRSRPCWGAGGDQ